MRILPLICCVGLGIGAGTGALVFVLLPQIVHAAILSPAIEDEHGLIGPILAVIAVIVLNVLVLAVAFRLRRHLQGLGERHDKE